MALIKFGGGVVQMSGSIAGDTFSRNRYGSYVRARTKPVNPNTARQVAVRAAVAFATSRWSQTLTGVQRTAWNLYADNVNMTNRLGETIHLSGFNHYVRSNCIKAAHASPAIDAGPVIFELPEQDPAFAITISEAGQQVSITLNAGLDWNNEDNALCWLFMGTPQNAQRNFFGGPWRYIGVISGDLAAPPAYPLLKDVSFAASEGQRVWCYARIQRADGRLGVPFRADVSVGA